MWERRSCLLAFLVAVPLVGSPVIAAEEEALADRAAAIHRDAIVIDGHNDVAAWIIDRRPASR